MSQQSRRTEPLPKNWAKLREAQLERDGFQCVWILPSGTRCPSPAVDVDHYGEAWEHHKLRSLCEPHHDKRTQRQAAEARRRKQMPVTPVRRPREQHPPYLA